MARGPLDTRSRVFLVHAQPIPAPAKLQCIPTTHHPTVRLRALSRRLRERTPAVALAAILCAKHGRSRTASRTLLHCHLRVEEKGPVQHARAHTVRVAALVRVARDGRVLRRLDGAGALEDVDARGAAAVGGAVA